MRMMPHAVACASVSMCIAHAGEARGASVRCWFSGSPKNITWLVETLQYMLSTFELFLVLFLLSLLLRWTDLFAFFFVKVASRWLR